MVKPLSLHVQPFLARVYFLAASRRTYYIRTWLHFFLTAKGTEQLIMVCMASLARGIIINI